MAGWLVFTLHSLYSRYQSYPYTTHFSVHQLDTLPLPAISICLRDSLQRSRLRQLRHSDVIENLLRGRGVDFENETVREILSGPTLQDVMDVGSFRAEEVILASFLRSEYLDPKLRFSVWLTASKAGAPQRCFTFNATDR